MKDPQFYLKSGELTRYALACGYQEVEELGDNRKRLYREHCTYMVVLHKDGETTTEYFDDNQLTQARNAYRKIKLT